MPRKLKFELSCITNCKNDSGTLLFLTVLILTEVATVIKQLIAMGADLCVSPIRNCDNAVELVR